MSKNKKRAKMKNQNSFSFFHKILSPPKRNHETIWKHLNVFIWMKNIKIYLFSPENEAHFLATKVVNLHKYIRLPLQDNVKIIRRQMRPNNAHHKHGHGSFPCTTNPVPFQ